MNDRPAGKTLYLCYFGLREPLVQTQVLPYLRELKKLDDLKVSLLTFETNPQENWTAEQIGNEKRKLNADGIEWNFLTYHKTPSAPATLYDIFCGAFFAWKMMRREPVEVLHARVHIPALMGAIARKFSRRRPKIVFDIRGFFPEEYTDAGTWQADGWLYKSVKRIEKWLFKESDGFVVLTEKARTVLFPESRESGYDKRGRPVEVIPCCVDFDKRFQADRETARQAMRRELKIPDRLVVVHVGALGGLYLAEEMADFLAAVREINPRTFAIFLTQTAPDLIVPLLTKRGFAPSDYFVGKVAPDEVQSYLNASDIALSFVKATFATLSRSPTKIPEYLACGLPIVSNQKVGDVDELITTERVGALLDDFSTASYIKALRQVESLKAEDDFVERCQAAAKKGFDLETVGGEKYRSLYRRLLSPKPAKRLD